MRTALFCVRTKEAPQVFNSEELFCFNTADGSLVWLVLDDIRTAVVAHRRSWSYLGVGVGGIQARTCAEKTLNSGVVDLTKHGTFS